MWGCLNSESQNTPEIWITWFIRFFINFAHMWNLRRNVKNVKKKKKLSISKLVSFFASCDFQAHFVIWNQYVIGKKDASIFISWLRFLNQEVVSLNDYWSSFSIHKHIPYAKSCNIRGYHHFLLLWGNLGIANSSTSSCVSFSYLYHLKNESEN